jgi:hypothetical protein
MIKLLPFVLISAINLISYRVRIGNGSTILQGHDHSSLTILLACCLSEMAGENSELIGSLLDLEMF